MKPQIAIFVILFVVAGSAAVHAKDTTYVVGNAEGTWDGIHLIDSKVQIRSGDTLVIKSGATVLMRGRNAGLAVKGVLYADGTRKRPVRFLSATASHWDRIGFIGPAGSELHYVIVRGSTYGVYCRNASVNLQYCVLNDNRERSLDAKNSIIHAYRSRIVAPNENPVSADHTNLVDFEACRVSVHPEKGTIPEIAPDFLTDPVSNRIPKLKPGFSTGLSFQRFNRKTDHVEQYRQIGTPLTASLDFGNKLTFLVNSSFAGFSDLANAQDLNGLTDLRLQGIYTTFKNRAMFIGGLNLPSGLAAISPSKEPLTNAMANEDFAFSTKRHGEGFGINIGAAYAGKITTNLKYGTGLGVYYKAPYKEFSDTSSNYDPGELLTMTGGLDYSFARTMLRFDAMASFFTEDKKGESPFYKQGPMLVVKASFIKTLRRINIEIGLYDLIRTKNTVDQNGILEKEPFATYGNRIGANTDLLVSITESIGMTTGLDLRIDSENGYQPSSPNHTAKRMIAIPKIGAIISLFESLSLEPQIKIPRGSRGEKYAIFGGTEMSGYEATVSLRYGM